MKLINILKGAAIFGAFTITATTQVNAEELRYAIGHPPSSLLITAGNEYAKVLEAETNGELTVKVYPLSLLSLAETSGGLRDGIADIGALMTPYFPAEYPHTNLIMEASMMLSTFGESAVGHEGVAYSAAMAELIFTKCPECNAEFDAQNQVFTGAGGTPGYALNCTKPIVTLDDFSGARLRIGGANWARWTEAMGATPITLSGNEMLEGLTQGIIDCLLLSIPDVQNFGMGESVTDVTLGAPGGVFVAAFANISKDTWTRVTVEQRTAMLKASSRAAAMITSSYQIGQADILKNFKTSGVTIHQAGPAVLAKTAEFAKVDLAAMPAAYKDKFGIERGEELLTDLNGLVAKWVELVQNAETLDDVADLYWSEIYSKVDVTVHGM